MAVKQIQCLLAYLDYYAGKVDGIAGQLTTTAIKSFQADYDGLKVDGVAGIQEALAKGAGV